MMATVKLWFFLSVGAVCLILLSFWVVVALYRLLRRPCARCLGFFLLFCAATVLYYGTDFRPLSRGERRIAANTSERFISSVNSALSIFFPSRGNYEDYRAIVNPDGSPDRVRRTAFLCLHYLAYCYFAAIMFSFFGARTADSIWTLWFFRVMPFLSSVRGCRWIGWNRRLKHFYVFWGVSDESLALADSLSKDKSAHGRCLFVLSRELWHEKEKYAAVADRLSARGHHVVWENLEKDGSWYENAGRHFFLGPDERENARLARLLVAAAVQKGILSLDVYVRGRTPKEIDGINIHHVEHADNAARYLFNAYPVLAHPAVTVDEKTLGVKGTYRTLIVGFAEIGQAVLKQHLLRNAYPGLSMKTDVVSGDGDALATFKLLHEKLFSGGAAGELALHEMAVGSARFLEWIGEKRGGYDRIVICPEDGTDCITLGERIARIIGSAGGDGSLPEIFAYDAWNESMKRRAKVKTFGKTSDLYTRELIVDGLRMQSLPAAMMSEMPNPDGEVYRKTFCHNATDRMLDIIGVMGLRTEKRSSGADLPDMSEEFAASVTANTRAVADAFGTARRAFMAWKGLPSDKYAETDELFARKFLELFKVGEARIVRK